KRIGWRNVRIGFKYSVAFLITVSLFLIATVIVYNQLNIAENDVETIIDQNELSNDLAQIALLIERKDSHVSSYILINNSSDIDLYESVSEDLNELLHKVEPYFQNDDNLMFFNRIKQNSTEIDDLFLNTVINS